jgi:hypothetical protein
MDLISCQETGRTLITAITRLINLLLDGECQPNVIAVLFGGKLFALN